MAVRLCRDKVCIHVSSVTDTPLMPSLRVYLICREHLVGLKLFPLSYQTTWYFVLFCFCNSPLKAILML